MKMLNRLMLCQCHVCLYKGLINKQQMFCCVLSRIICSESKGLWSWVLFHPTTRQPLAFANLSFKRNNSQNSWTVQCQFSFFTVLSPLIHDMFTQGMVAWKNAAATDAQSNLNFFELWHTSLEALHLLML